MNGKSKEKLTQVRCTFPPVWYELAAADRRYLLVDHTKLGRNALHEIAPLSEFDGVVVDAAAPAGALDELRDSGATVVIAA